MVLIEPEFKQTGGNCTYVVRIEAAVVPILVRAALEFATALMAVESAPRPYPPTEKESVSGWPSLYIAGY